MSRFTYQPDIADAIVGVVVVAVLALAAGCSATSSPVPAPSSARPDATTTLAIASPSQGGLSGPSVSSSGGAPGVTPGRALRCASALSPGLASIELGGPTPTDRLAAGEVGSGSVAVVLLHQTGRAAMCGWAPYAGWLATQGVRVLALDFCGYGQSTCQSASFAADPVAQVKVAVELRPRRNPNHRRRRVDGWHHRGGSGCPGGSRRGRRSVRAGPMAPLRHERGAADPGPCRLCSRSMN